MERLFNFPKVQLTPGDVDKHCSNFSNLNLHFGLRLQGAAPRWSGFLLINLMAHAIPSMDD